MFSSSDIIKVSLLIFNSLRHFEFIFVYDVREYSNFMYFSVSVQLSQYHLLKKLSLLNCIFLPPLSKINWLWVCGFIYGVSVPFHWTICLFLCQYHALLFSVLSVMSEVWEVYAFNFVLFPQDCFGHYGSFVVPNKFYDYLF